MREVKVAFVAPGQGFTSWEDGLKLLEESPDTEKIYEAVHQATGIDVIEVCRSTEPVDDTSVVQPAALAIGVARAEALKSKDINPDYLIGLSAGEFTVAAISGALSLSDAAQFVQKRGQYQMEAAGNLGGAITALHRKPINIGAIMQGLEGVWHANDHAPTITGFSYLHEHYETLKARLAAQGAKVRDVNNLHFPPHGDAVIGAQRRIAELLGRRGAIKDASTAIISIRTAKVMRKARTIRRNLVWQTTQTTRLNDAVNQALRSEVEAFYDLGPGDAMTKLLGNIVTQENVMVIAPGAD